MERESQVPDITDKSLAGLFEREVRLRVLGVDPGTIRCGWGVVDFDGPIDLFAYARLQEEIGQRLGLRVDLVHRPGIKPAIGASIMREVQPV